MKIEWKYAPAWASEVRKHPVSGKLVWCGHDHKKHFSTPRCVDVENSLPIYVTSAFDEWPLICKRGDDIELTDGLLHVYTIAGHKLYAESPEVGGIIKQLFADRTNQMADHFELGE